MPRRSQTREMQASIDDLRRKRNAIKIKSKCIYDSFLGNAEQPLTQNTVNAYLIKLEELLLSNEQIYDSLNLVLEDAELEQNNNEFNTMHTELIKVNDAISSLLIIPDAPLRTDPPNRNNEVDVRLPLIDLPKFFGDIQQWESFHDLFTTLVVNQPRFDNVQKFQYLKVSLTGEAAKIVQSIPITKDNFDRAWKAVTGRYEDKRSIINAHFQKLLNQNPLKQESPTDLRNLLDTTNECIEGLNARSDIPDKWDYILVFLTSGKLDPESKKQWELSVANNKLPTYKQLNEFLENRARSLFAAGLGTKSSQESKNKREGKATVLVNNNNNKGCPKCKLSHFLNQCPEFKKLNVQDRFKFVKDNSLCVICLASGHTAKDCKKDWKCKLCDKKHNNMLHFGKKPEERAGEARSVLFSNKRKQSQVLLATAVVYVADKNDQLQKCRVLFDQGAEASLITECCANRLGLTRSRTCVEITGVGNSISSARGQVNFDMISHDQTFSFPIQALVMGRITGLIPRYRCETQEWSHLTGLHLADPEFFEPSHIDILIGAEYVGYLLNSQKIESPLGGPVAQDTKFGWILSGPTNCDTKRVFVATSNAEVDNSLRAFWELEETDYQNDKNAFTSEEKECEEHFAKTHSRDASGRFIVELPFRAHCAQLGESKTIAEKRWNTVEKRISKNPDMYAQYQKCLQEYLDLNHMELVPENEIDKEDCYYIPHHAVIKQSSATTKCRVVFDASAKSSTGVSLNDILMIGPKLQDDLVTIIIRFGIHAEPLVADIAKMYRQFLVHPKHRDFQRIIWRPSLDVPNRIYRLNTVTFGVSSAPYLAIKCVQQHALNEQLRYPLASPAVLNDLYVDNLSTGASNTEQALELQKEVLDLMNDAGMVMRQWSAHNPVLLESLSVELRENPVIFGAESDYSIKTLGIQWHPGKDVYSFKVNTPLNTEVITKRILLSNIARLFDPLGWLSPVNIIAKILLQDTWKSNLKWDDPLPIDIQEKWKAYQSDLPSIESVVIPRRITSDDAMFYELHGFSDASEKAYSAVVYLLQVNQNSENRVFLIASKTRVAPIKTITIPRSELCGAVLLSKLMRNVKNSLPIPIKKVHAYSDSTIVLNWLNSHAGRWKIFVANRVSEIQSNIPAPNWHHVIGKENPADVASRGVFPSQLLDHPLWWHGPSWLSEKGFLPPDFTVMNNDDDVSKEERVQVFISKTNKNKKAEKENERREGISIFSRFSKLQKLVNVFAYCRRFIHNCRNHTKISGKVSLSEYQDSLQCLIKLAQKSEFEEELSSLKFGGIISSQSSLLTLNPFIKDGILRVGGRLRNAKIPENQKFPILLPKYHLLTDLIIADLHDNNLHAGPQLMLATLFQNYWVIGARDLVRHYVRSCVSCRRLSARTGQQIMANLPTSRVLPQLAFQKCGIDYAGPVPLLTQQSRKSKLRQGYIVIFVCFVTKAVHLELASDMSASTFLATLERFIGRRGNPSDIYCDNGRNFVRAEKEMRLILEKIIGKNTNNVLNKFLMEKKITWHFNPPAAPHFGGLWEAGIKSVKYHLRRVVKNSKLTFEEFDTLLKRIEAGLNSRPLTPLSSDPSDLQVLTPGHFLIGRPLNALPQLDVKMKPISLLKRWQYVSHLFQHFWNRWSKEYLSGLQKRTKWLLPQRDFQEGDIVLIKKDNFPPLEWPLGRVSKIHAGSDGKTRVVTVETEKSQYIRPISKLVLLPIENTKN